jgi:hypothetical protein
VGAKVVAFLVQYWVFRSIVRDKLRAGQSTPAPQSSKPTVTA